MKKILSMVLVTVMLAAMAVPCFANTAVAEPVYFEDFSKSADTYTSNSANTDNYNIIAENGRLKLSPKVDKALYAYQLPDAPVLSGVTALTVAMTFRASASAGTAGSTGLQCIMTPAFGITNAGEFNFAGHATSTATETQYIYGHVENGAYKAGNGASNLMLNYQNKVANLEMDKEYIMVLEMTNSTMPVVTYYNAEGVKLFEQTYALNEMKSVNFDFSSVANFDGPLGFVVRNNTFGGTCTLNAIAAYTSVGVDHTAIINKITEGDTNRGSDDFEGGEQPSDTPDIDPTPNTTPIYFNDFSDKSLNYADATGKYDATVENGALTLFYNGGTDFYAYTLPDSPTLSGLEYMTIAVKFTPSITAAFSAMTTAFGIDDSANFLFAGYATGALAPNDRGNQYVYAKVKNAAYDAATTANSYAMDYAYIYNDEAQTSCLRLELDKEYIMIVEMGKNSNPIVTYYDAETNEKVAYFITNMSNGYAFSNIANFDGKLGFAYRNSCEGIYDSIVAYESNGLDHQMIITQLNTQNDNAGGDDNNGQNNDQNNNQNNGQGSGNETTDTQQQTTETNAPETNADTSETTESGCASSLSAWGIALVAVAVALVVLLKKRPIFEE